MTTVIQGWDSTNTKARRLEVDANGYLKIVEQSPITGFATEATLADVESAVDGIEALLAGGLPSALDTDSLKIREQGTPTIRCTGYDGSNWQNLLVESATNPNLRAKLYSGANELYSVSGSPDLLGLSTGQALAVAAIPYLRYGNDAAYAAQTGYNVGDNNNAVRVPCTTLMGFDGSNWDRLRAYNTGILKVGRAEVGLSTRRGVTDATIKASAGKVYWITIFGRDATNSSAGHLMDGGSGGTTRWSGGIVAGLDVTLHTIFDPPIEFATDIYIDHAVRGGGTEPVITIGYL